MTGLEEIKCVYEFESKYNSHYSFERQILMEGVYKKESDRFIEMRVPLCVSMGS